MKIEYSLGIVIPVYNVEKYLKECLDSVVKQTVPFDEVILINDGSSDGSLQICEKYCKVYSYFQLVNQKNQGLGAARNHGMSLLKSDYFIFLDSDDYICLRTVELIKRKLNNQDILFYASEIHEGIEGITHLNPYIRKEFLCNQVMSGLDFFNQSFPESHIVSACMAVYRRDFLEKCNIKFLEGVYYEDECFYIKTIIYAKRIESITQRLYVRRFRSGSITMNGMSQKKSLDWMNVQIKIWDEIKTNLSTKWRKEILCKYLLENASEALRRAKKCDGMGDLEEQETLFCRKFIQYWGELCRKNLILLGEYKKLLEIYKKAGESKRIEYKEIKSLFIEKLKQKLEFLPLNNKYLKVGIYGTGKHTKSMFHLYEKYVGDIKCNYFYIVSDIVQTKTDLENGDRMTVSYKNMPKDVDLIIISSLIYMEDMQENMKSINIGPEKMCLLYSPGETCDLVVADEFINNEASD